MRTARSRTSGENLFDFFMMPSSQLIGASINRGAIHFVCPTMRWETTLYFSECLAAHGRVMAETAWRTRPYGATTIIHDTP